MTTSRVAVHTTARVVEPYAPGACAALLEFRVSDPMEVRVTFSDGPLSVTWSWSREDLAAAANGGRAGFADVRMWREGAEVMVRLESDLPGLDGTTCCVLALPLTAVRRFLALAHGLVPYGREGDHLDLDAELRALLGAD